MQQKTLELIEELRKDYNVYVEGEDFTIDNYTFSEYGDKLLVNYSVKHAEDDFTEYEEKIESDLSEVVWWVNSGRDY
jgi:DNA-directed RNA polymerase subunit L